MEEMEEIKVCQSKGKEMRWWFESGRGGEECQWVWKCLPLLEEWGVVNGTDGEF